MIQPVGHSARKDRQEDSTRREDREEGHARALHARQEGVWDSPLVLVVGVSKLG